MRKTLIKTRGFTLIELLIVITIIAILISLSIVSFRGAVLRSKNTRIAANLAQIRKIAEKIFTYERNGYIDLCAIPNGGNLNSANDELDILQRDIQTLQGSGGRTYCYSNQNSYCLNIGLAGGGQYLCVDSTGRFSPPFTPSGSLQLCASATSQCP